MDKIQLGAVIAKVRHSKGEKNAGHFFRRGATPLKNHHLTPSTQKRVVVKKIKRVAQWEKF